MEESPHKLPGQPLFPTQKPQQNPQRIWFSKGNAKLWNYDFIGHLPDSAGLLASAAVDFLSTRTKCTAVFLELNAGGATKESIHGQAA